MRHHSSYKSYKPRSIKKYENRTRRRIIFTIILSIIILYITFAYALPFLIGSLAVFQKKSAPVAQKYDETLAPPILNIPFDATNSATINIDGYAAPDTTIELYNNDTLVQKSFTDSSGEFVFSQVALQIGRNYLYGKTIADSKTSLPSKGIKLDYSNEQPNLSIETPADNQVISGDRTLKISGKTDPNDATLTINNKQVYIDGNGNFSDTFQLNDGDNQITVIATNKYGNSAVVSRKVTFNP